MFCAFKIDSKFYEDLFSSEHLNKNKKPLYIHVRDLLIAEVKQKSKLYTYMHRVYLRKV